ncbi:MAG: hypothetical protein A2043_06495, partial [Candidatus Schekmanbacteria bacterium GWA2_38_9]
MNIRKITLIEPKSPGIHVFSRIPIPRLGLPILGTILARKGFDVKIYVEDLNGINFDDVLSSDLIGISSITTTATGGYEIAKKANERGIPVILGGVHNTFLPDEGLKYADYIVRGEGEETFEELIDALIDGKDLSEIHGLSFKKDETPVHNPPRNLQDNLNLYPVPDLSLIDGYKKMKVLPVSTSRGCPFNCNFCSVTAINGKNYRFRNHELIIEELKKANRRHVFFVDDNFTANKERTKTLLEYMLSKNVAPEWSAQARVDVVNDNNLLKLMKRTGCYNVYIGFESINPNTLKLFKKGQQLEDIEQSIKKLHEENIQIHGMFVFGSDEDDIKTIRETVAFAKRLNIDSVQFMILTPLPGTQTYESYKKESRILTYDWNLYDAHHVVYTPKKMTPFELQKETFKAMNKFYSWVQILKRVWARDAYNVVIKTYAKNIISKWKKDNYSYMKDMKSGVPYQSEDEKHLFPFSIRSKLKTIGIPGASLHLGSREFLKSFFGEVGVNFKFADIWKNINSEKNSGSVFKDACLPVKFTFNQLSELKDKVDIILIPEIKAKIPNQYCQHLSSFIEKMKTLKDGFPPIVNFLFDPVNGPSYQACSKVGLLFTQNIKKIHNSYHNAVSNYKETIMEKLKSLKDFGVKKDEKSLKIAFLSPPYILHNSNLSGPILNFLKEKELNHLTDKNISISYLPDGTDLNVQEFFCSSDNVLFDMAHKFSSDSTIDGIIILGSEGCFSSKTTRSLIENNDDVKINKPLKVLQLREDLNFNSLISD